MNDSENNYKTHYFDWAATSPADEDILKQAVELTLKDWGNPSSTHQVGKNARTLLEQARDRAAKALGVPSSTVYFTSGGTESDQIPLLAQLCKPAKGTVLISSIEHPAVREQALALKSCGWKVEQLDADKNGIITPQTVIDSLTSDTTLVCIMAVNNETGVIQPIYEIADAITKWSAGKRKPKFHVDCVQAAGKIQLNLAHPGIDSAALSSHKICGPRGIGILYMKDQIDVFLRGGGQEKGIRSGTENVLGAVAFSLALERYYNKEKPELVEASAKFVEALSKLKGCTIVPPGRLQNPELFSPYVVQASFDHIPGNVMLRALDSKGFYISTGSACSSKKNKRPVLEAMHITPQISENAVRFSFGPHTTAQAIDELFDAVSKVNSQFNK
ncbi:MAG: cysteine desulfurase [Treponema sp.]|nr:cysteine desulfurase [Treponema sp.]MBR5032482.1 cysteine desulfurase [Treponema sp.]